MIWYLRLVPAILVVSLVVSGVAELVYRGVVGARQRWSSEPEGLFELYTYGLPAGAGEAVSRQFCGKLEGYPIALRQYSDPLEFRARLRYRIRRRPGAALIALPAEQRAEPHPLEPLIHASLLWSDLIRPEPELARLRLRLLKESRAAGALPILAGPDGAELARPLEIPVAASDSPAALADALAEMRGERPRCRPAPTVGR